MEVLENVFPENHPLSNCCPVPLEYGGRTWASSEHAYQAQKFMWPVLDVVRILYNADDVEHAYEIATDLDLTLSRDDVAAIWNAEDEAGALEIASGYDMRTNLMIIGEIIQAESGPEASRIARDSERYVRPGWDDIRVGIMYHIMETKFRLNNRRVGKEIGVGEELMNTEENFLHEEADGLEFASYFWGIDAEGNGLNVIGLILMDIRAKLLVERPFD